MLIGCYLWWLIWLVLFPLIAVKRQIMRHQSPTTGLFPHDLSRPNAVEAHVRDSLYCATCLWALSQAFKLVSHWFLIWSTYASGPPRRRGNNRYWTYIAINIITHVYLWVCSVSVSISLLHGGHAEGEITATIMSICVSLGASIGEWNTCRYIWYWAYR